MEIFDTHAHYDDRAFDEDREELLKALTDNGITRIVNISEDIRTSENTVRLSKSHDFIYGAVGIHPNDCADTTEDDIEALRDMAEKNDKIVAIGEIGLDYHYDEPPKDIQKKWFERQIELAASLKLPIVIHSRDAAQDTLDIIKGSAAPSTGGVMHCYAYSKEMAKTYVDMGFFIGVGGVVTFKNARKLVETVEYIPMESIVVETDCPYLAPVPFRGKRNSSLYLPYVIEKIAEIKGMDPEEVAKITFENAKRLYNLS